MDMPQLVVYSRTGLTGDDTSESKNIPGAVSTVWATVILTAAASPLNVYDITVKVWRRSSPQQLWWCAYTCREFRNIASATEAIALTASTVLSDVGGDQVRVTISCRQSFLTANVTASWQ